ncbi:MAG: MFS transporter [Planctomycetota bacterium]|jgi:MFS family permease
MPDPQEPDVGYGELLRSNRSFRSLFAARLISLLGDWFNTLAILALLRELIGTDATTFAWVLIFKTIPSVLAAPIAGVVADRMSRRTILIASDVSRALVVLAMFSVLVFPSAPLLYSLVILQTVLATFFEPARSALLPDIVSKRELTAANALGAAAWSAMLTLGAALGGVVTDVFGWETAIAIDAATYLVSAGLILRIVEPPRAKATTRRAGFRELSGLRDLTEGFRYVLARPRVLTLMLVKCGWCVAGGITLVITLLGERVHLVGGRAMLGVALLYAARGLGTGTGPILSRWLSKSDPAAMERLIFWGFACGAVFYLPIPWAGNPVTAAALVALAHLGGATIWVFSTIRLQQIVPTFVRGRVFAAEQGLFTVVMATSTWTYGRLLDSGTISVRAGAGWLGLSLLLPAALWFFRGQWLGYGTEDAPREERAP